MTIHMFRIFVGRGPMAKSDLETRINDWIAKNDEWVNDDVDHVLKETNTRPGDPEIGTDYARIDVRFKKSDAKDNLQQKLLDKLKDKVAWVRVAYHECAHDENEPERSVSWTTVKWTAKDATIPPDIPPV